MVLEVLESDSVESTNAVDNENKYTDFHVNMNIAYINGDLNVTDNKENDTDNNRKFQRTSLTRRRTRYSSTRQSTSGFQMLWTA